jgi:hypothetical protein
MIIQFFYALAKQKKTENVQNKKCNQSDI